MTAEMAPVPGGGRARHRLSAKTGGADGVAKIHRPGANERRVFTQAVPGQNRRRRPAAFGGKGAKNADIHRQHGGLGVFGLVQIPGGFVAHRHSRQVDGNGVGGLGQRLPHLGMGVKGLRHSGKLRSLPGKDHCKSHRPLASS